MAEFDIAELRQRFSRTRLCKNKFASHNFIELEAFEPDRAIYRLEMREESTNNRGMLHGGLTYTLADMATGTAACTDGRSYVTQNGALNYIGAQAEGVVRAIAQVRHRGRSTVVVTVDVVGENDKLLATGEFTFFCIGETW